MPLISPAIILQFLSPLAATPNDPLSWEVALERARSHPAVRSVEANVASMRAAQRQAGVLPNPHFEVELLPEQDSAVELRVELPLDGVLKRGPQQAAAEVEADAEELRLKERQVEVAYRMRVAWLEWVGAREQRRLGEERREVQWAALEFAQALAQAGNLPDLELTRHQLNAAQAESELFPLRQAEREKEAALDRWWLDGDTTGLPVQLPELPSEAPPSRKEEALVAANLALAKLSRGIVAVGHRQELNQLEAWLPELALDVHALIAEDGADGRPWRWGAGLSMELPLFDQRSGHANRLDAQREALAFEQEDLRLGLLAAGREALARRALAYQAAEQLRRAVDPANAKLQVELQRQYNAMQLGPFALVDGRLRALTLQSQLASARLAYWLSEARVEALWSGHQVGAITPTLLENRATAPQGDH